MSLSLRYLDNRTYAYLRVPEAVAIRCSAKKVFLEISSNSQKTLVPEPLF